MTPGHVGPFRCRSLTFKKHLGLRHAFEGCARGPRVLLIPLALANPGKDDFVRWFDREAEAAARGHDGLSQLSLLERTLEVKASLRRDNYLLFSVFHVRVMTRDNTFVGVLGRFVGVGDARQAVPGAS